MPAVTDFFSLQALVSAGGWGIGALLAVHSFQISARRQVQSLVYGGICMVFFVGSWWLAAAQHQESASATATLAGIADKVSEISQLVAPNSSAPPDKILSAAATKILDLQGQVNDLKRQAGTTYPFDEAEAATLVLALREVPPEQRFPVDIKFPPGTDAYARNVEAVFKAADWPRLTVNVLLTGKSDWHGLIIFYAEEEDQGPPYEAQFLAHFVQLADYPVQKGLFKGFTRGHAMIVVCAPP